MKKILALLLCVALALSLVACGAEKNSNPDDNTDTVVTTTAEGIGTTTADETVTATTDKEVDIMISQANAQAEILIAEGEAEYMKILSDAYADPDKAQFYNFVRSLDAAKASLTNGKNVLFLGPDSPLTQIFYTTEPEEAPASIPVAVMPDAE